MTHKPMKTILGGAALAAILATSAPVPANAGGLFGDLFRAVGLGGVGNALDAAHRDFKKAMPVYGTLEEAGSGAVHHLFTELGVETAGPVLAGLIRAGISDANNGTLSPLPEPVKARLSSYFSRDLLDRVRWRSGYGTASLQGLSVELGGADAVTLDTIIVFRDGRDVENLYLVAHELGHVLQYQSWGITDFAKRYVRNYSGVEAAAEQVAKDWQAGKRLAAPARGIGGGGGGGGSLQPRMMQRL